MRITAIRRFALAMLALICMLHYLQAGGQADKMSYCKVLVPMSVFLLTGLYYRHHENEESDKVMILLLSAVLVFQIVLGYCQLLGLAGTSENIFRLCGSFGNPNPYSAFLSMSFAVLFLYQRKMEKGVWKNIIRVLLLLTLTLLPATKCRTSAIGLPAGLVLPLFFSDRSVRLAVRRHFLILSLLSVILLTGLYLCKKPSADGRLFLYRMASITLLRSGLAGSGPGTQQPQIAKVQAEWFGKRIDFENASPTIPEDCMAECRASAPVTSSFNDCFMVGIETGVLGLLSFAVIVLTSLQKLLGRASPWAGGLTVLTVFSQFNCTLNMWLFAVALAMMCAMAVGTVPVQIEKSGRCVAVLQLVTAVLPAAICLPFLVRYHDSRTEWNMEQNLFMAGDFKPYERCCRSRSHLLERELGFMNSWGYALAMDGQISASDSVYRTGYEMTGNPSFLLALGDNRLELCDYKAAEKYYKTAFLAVPDRLTPLLGLAKVYARMGETVKLMETVRFAESFHPQVESVATDAARQEMEKLKISCGL